MSAAPPPLSRSPAGRATGPARRRRPPRARSRPPDRVERGPRGRAAAPSRAASRAAPALASRRRRPFAPAVDTSTPVGPTSAARAGSPPGSAPGRRRPPWAAPVRPVARPEPATPTGTARAAAVTPTVAEACRIGAAARVLPAPVQRQVVAVGPPAAPRSASATRSSRRRRIPGGRPACPSVALRPQPPVDPAAAGAAGRLRLRLPIVQPAAPARRSRRPAERGSRSATTGRRPVLAPPAPAIAARQPAAPQARTGRSDPPRSPSASFAADGRRLRRRRTPSPCGSGRGPTRPGSAHRVRRSSRPRAVAPSSARRRPPPAPPAEPTAARPPRPRPRRDRRSPAAADLDELARRLFEPLSARLRAELWLDRERAGLVTDVRPTDAGARMHDREA